MAIRGGERPWKLKMNRLIAGNVKPGDTARALSNGSSRNFLKLTPWGVDWVDLFHLFQHISTMRSPGVDNEKQFPVTCISACYPSCLTNRNRKVSSCINVRHSKQSLFIPSSQYLRSMALFRIAPLFPWPFGQRQQSEIGNLSLMKVVACLRNVLV